MKKLYVSIFLTALVGLGLQSHGAAPAKGKAPAAADLAMQMAKSSSLLFMENNGQVADDRGNLRPDVLFTASSAGAKVFITGNAITYVFYKKVNASGPVSEATGRMEEDLAGDKQQFERAHFSVQLTGANARPEVIKDMPQAYYENYYFMHCPQGVRANSYQGFTLKNVYPGVDWVFRSNGQGMKYDFVCASPAAANQVKLQVNGATASLDASGNLLMTTPLGQVTEQAPVSFQQGSVLPSRFETLDNQQFTFVIKGARSGSPLTIDPAIVWVNQFGGSGAEDPRAIARNSSGKMVAVGLTASSTIPGTANAYQSTHGGGTQDAYISGFSSTGTLEWATFMGGTTNDLFNCVIDLDGNWLAGGRSTGVFPTTANALQPNQIGGDEAVLAKFASDGTVIYATYNSWSGGDVYMYTMAKGPVSGDIYIGGSTTSATAGTTGTFRTTLMGSYDHYVSRYREGVGRIWTTFSGGTTAELDCKIAVDSSENVYLTGYTTASAEIASTGATQTTLGGGRDAYVAQFTNAGVRNWSTYLGGTSDETPYDILTDGKAVYVCGQTASSNFPVTSGAIQTTRSGGSDAFVTCYSTTGSVNWSTYLGGNNAEIGYALTMEAGGTLIVGGQSSSTTFTSPLNTTSNAGSNDAMVARLRPDGSLRTFTLFGGTGSDIIRGITTAGRLVYAVASSTSTTINGITPSGTASGSTEQIILTIDTCQAPTKPTITAGSTTNLCAGGSVTLTAPAGFEYLWSTGATTQSITVSTAGSYTVRTISGACTSAVSNATAVTVTTTPAQPTITAGGPTTFNTGGSVTLSAPAGFSYLWSTGETSQSINVTADGSYTVQTIAGSCTSAVSNATVVTVISTPQDLLVEFGDDVTASGTYASITVELGGRLTLTGNTVSNGDVNIDPGATLNTNCFVLSGAGEFNTYNSSTLEICDPAGISASGNTGAIQMTGGRNYSNGTVFRYNGTAPQLTGDGLPTGTDYVIVDNPTTVTLSRATTIDRVLRLEQGTFNTANLLTLASNGDRDAAVVNINGVATNLATVQRWVSDATFAGTGNHFVSSPVANMPLANYTTTQSNFTPVLNTAYNTAANKGGVRPFPTVFAYDFNLTSAAATANGWFVPTGIAQPGRGYNFTVQGGATLQARGTLNNGNITYQGDNVAAEALHLMGNPYPSAIDWDELNRTGLYDSYYTWQPLSATTGRYAAYVNGMGTNDATNEIPMSTGFFVSTSQPNASLAFDNAARIAPAIGRVRLRRAARPVIRLQIASGTQTDEAIVYFDPMATTGFDGNADARNLPSALNLFSHSGGQRYAINGQPAAFATDGLVHSYALGFSAQTAGTYSIKLKEFSLLDGLALTLIDNQLGTATLMNANDVYTFQAAAGSNLTRFVIQLGAAPTAAKASLASSLSVFPNPAKDRLEVSGLGQGASLMLINSVGQTVRTAAVDYSTSMDLNGLAAGVYTLRIVQDGQMVMQKVVKE